MSMMTWAVPVEPLKTAMLPSVPTWTVTRLGMFWPATKLRLEARGRSAPLG
jgi:hypothetical protein